MTPMRLLAVVLLVACAARAEAKIALANSNVPTATVVTELKNHCKETVIVLDQKAADALVEVQVTDEPRHRGQTQLTVYKGGAAVFSTRTTKAGNAVKDMCKFLGTLK